MFAVDSAMSRGTVLPPKTKKSSSLRKRKVQVRAQAALSSGRLGRAWERPRRLSRDTQASDGPSKQGRVRPLCRHKDDAL